MLTLISTPSWIAKVSTTCFTSSKTWSSKKVRTTDSKSMLTLHQKSWKNSRTWSPQVPIRSHSCSSAVKCSLKMRVRPLHKRHSAMRLSSQSISLRSGCPWSSLQSKYTLLTNSLSMSRLGASSRGKWSCTFKKLPCSSDKSSRQNLKPIARSMLQSYPRSLTLSKWPQTRTRPSSKTSCTTKICYVKEQILAKMKILHLMQRNTICLRKLSLPSSMEIRPL